MTDTADTTDTDTDIAVDAQAPADAPAGAESKFTKVVARDEESGITHYSPKPHVEVDPSTRHN
ncbi:hypothetical protein BH23ACT12_BH23ACT12_22980 [soil metagenome]